jgi:hypothetical protein
MGNTLASGATLSANSSLTSTGGNYTLLMSGNGNLILINNSTGTPIWQSRTPAHPGAILYMQPNGDLSIIYNGSVIWHSNTAGHPSAYLMVQDDGTIDLYDLGGNKFWTEPTAAPQMARVDGTQVANAAMQIRQGLDLLDQALATAKPLARASEAAEHVGARPAE